MSFSLLEACRKRKRWPKVFRFHSFANPGCPINPNGPFRDNIRLFLQECGELEDFEIQGMPLWTTFLIHEKSNCMTPLYTIEENVYHSTHPFCDHCRCAGWSGHFVSKRRYHFIIPDDNKPLTEGFLDNQSHLLHGIIHCNGYGHLLCVNGIEGGSKFLSGREIMDLWDRICTTLRTRKIAVEDTSKKRLMDLRLLHGVAYGHSWFGRWGYRFCRGSFGVKEQNYDAAIELLSSLELDEVVQCFSNTIRHKEIKQIIRHYRDMSETQLITIKDLLRFMLTVKSRAPPPPKRLVFNITVPPPSNFCSKNSTRFSMSSKHNPLKEKSVRYKKFSSAMANMDSRWPTRRLEYAAQVIVDALKENKTNSSGSGGMTRQDVRDAARLHIGDTGLLDYVLKSLNNMIVGNYVVRRMVNPTTRILEYSIHELGNGSKAPELHRELKVFNHMEPPAESEQVPGIDVYSDVAFFYKNVLLGYPDSEQVDLAIQTILDSRHFVKEWSLFDEIEQVLTFICRLIPNFVDDKQELNKEVSPGEIVLVPLHATVGDLKQAAETALRDTYCIAERVMVIEIAELVGISDEEVLFGLVESGVDLRVRGIGLDLVTPLKYQGGADNWKVTCECGAQDDDGERMVACDICEVWQHTRCCGIDDSETVPPLFVCSGCCDSLVPPRVDSAFSNDSMDCADDFLISSEPNNFLEFGYGY
ncbi:PHD finger protein MALE MEIOCYTE DEATH 1-like [Prosopis cineraria]|uniref:PHD finger protein MALE MEIOCYTE DEATH 1-like n=1 Tax=Prosopis cineraria TaxID=364024 RepID=UPI0024107E46|nr:PHD finger protein MALE MEIOCYTE DEATH 1-like [Prosopis cineraria]